MLYLETVSQRRVAQHEKYALIVNQVFERNRLKSFAFTRDIGGIVRARQGQLAELKRNFEDLIVKNKQIEEHVEQMKKQINEMTTLANMRKEKDFLVIDIQDTELRITQLKKLLGVRENNDAL